MRATPVPAALLQAHAPGGSAFGQTRHLTQPPRTRRAQARLNNGRAQGAPAASVEFFTRLMHRSTAPQSRPSPTCLSSHSDGHTQPFGQPLQSTPDELPMPVVAKCADPSPPLLEVVTGAAEITQLAMALTHVQVQRRIPASHRRHRGLGHPLISDQADGGKRSQVPTSVPDARRLAHRPLSGQGSKHAVGRLAHQAADQPGRLIAPDNDGV